MSNHMYAIARQLQAPGVKTVATFNPTRLSRTIRNMARKSIASGYHTGGWSSMTRDVRELVFSLAGEKPIVYVAQGADYMSFIEPTPWTNRRSLGRWQASWLAPAVASAHSIMLGGVAFSAASR